MNAARPVQDSDVPEEHRAWAAQELLDSLADGRVPMRLVIQLSAADSRCAFRHFTIPGEAPAQPQLALPFAS